MLWANCFPYVILIWFSQKPYEVASIMTPISKIRKLKLGEIKSLVQGSTSVQTQVCLTVKSKFFNPPLYRFSLSNITNPN